MEWLSPIILPPDNRAKKAMMIPSSNGKIAYVQPSLCNPKIAKIMRLSKMI